jgi:hypothetical protein
MVLVHPSRVQPTQGGSNIKIFVTHRKPRRNMRWVGVKGRFRPLSSLGIGQVPVAP